MMPVNERDCNAGKSRALRAGYKCLALLSAVLVLSPVAGAQAPAPGAGKESPEKAQPSTVHKPRNGARSRDPKHAATVQQQLAANPKLAEKLQSLLPPETDVQQAARGFTDLQTFTAAVYIAHNLGMPIGELRNAINKRNAANLAKVIRQQNPNVDAKYEEQRANKAAREDLAEFRAQGNGENQEPPRTVGRR